MVTSRLSPEIAGLPTGSRGRKPASTPTAEKLSREENIFSARRPGRRAEKIFSSLDSFSAVGVLAGFLPRDPVGSPAISGLKREVTMAPFRRGSLLVLLLAGLCAGQASAQTFGPLADHLKCYKV